MAKTVHVSNFTIHEDFSNFFAVIVLLTWNGLIFFLKMIAFDFFAGKIYV